jgi:hypothetical protein
MLSNMLSLPSIELLASKIDVKIHRIVDEITPIELSLIFVSCVTATSYKLQFPVHFVAHSKQCHMMKFNMLNQTCMHSQFNRSASLI